jgi:hypothetical protein
VCRTRKRTTSIFGGGIFWNQLSSPRTRKALELYTRATELDPKYALAWAGLADALAASPINGDAPPQQVWESCSLACICWDWLTGKLGLDDDQEFVCAVDVFVGDEAYYSG